MITFAERWLEPLWIGLAVHLWQTALFLGLLCVLARLLRNAPAKLLSTLYWIGILKLLLPLPLLGEGSRLLLEWGRESLAAKVPDGGISWSTVTAIIYPTLLGPASPDQASLPEGAYLALTLAWLTGACILAVRWLRPAPSTRTGSSRRIDDCSENVRRKLRAAIEGIGLPAEAVRVGATIPGPAVRGALRPVVVLPDVVTEGLEPDELRAILIHEREHWRNRDPFRYAVLAAVGMTFFFFPPVWWLVRRIRETTEMACDEAVVRAGLSAQDYCRSLSRTLTLGLAGQAVADPVGILGHRASFLLRRLKRIRSHRRFEAMHSHRLVVTVAAVAALAVSLLPLAPDSSSQASAGTPPPDEGPPAVKPLIKAKLKVAGKDGVSLPVLIDKSKVNPVYPESALKAKVMGSVVLQAVVDKAGHVQDIEVMKLEPKDHGEFADSAIEAVSRWRYEPATLEGEPVDVYFTIRIEYKLDSKAKPGEKPAEPEGPVT